MSKLSKEQKLKIFKEYGGSEQNTGSVKAQVAMFTERIQSITEHLKTSKKDYSTTRALVKLVGKRRRLLNYLQRTDLEGYRELVKKLDLRK
ncbi:MAG: 30S ribosomal protein S15 [Chitinophagales bacterium]|nr:MAG: 30S ribosomal protein S15 [Chitinophagales bacterium]